MCPRNNKDIRFGTKRGIQGFFTMHHAYVLRRYFLDDFRVIKSGEGM